MKYQQICSYVINDNLSQHFPLNAKSIDRKVNLTPVHVKASTFAALHYKNGFTR